MVYIRVALGNRSIGGNTLTASQKMLAPGPSARPGYAFTNTYNSTRAIKQPFVTAPNSAVSNKPIPVGSTVFCKKQEEALSVGPGDLTNTLDKPTLNYLAELAMSWNVESKKPKGNKRSLAMIDSGFAQDRRIDQVTHMTFLSPQQFHAKWNYLGVMHNEEIPRIAMQSTNPTDRYKSYNTTLLEGDSVINTYTVKARMTDQFYETPVVIRSPYQYFYSPDGDRNSQKTSTNIQFPQIIGFSDKENLFHKSISTDYRPDTDSQIWDDKDIDFYWRNQTLSAVYNICEPGEVEGRVHIRKIETTEEIPQLVYDMFVPGQSIRVGVCLENMEDELNPKTVILGNRIRDVAMTLPKLSINIE